MSEKGYTESYIHHNDKGKVEDDKHFNRREEGARYKRSKRCVDFIWEGFYEDDQYISFATKNNKVGNKIAEIQHKILKDNR